MIDTTQVWELIFAGEVEQALIMSRASRRTNDWQKSRLADCPRALYIDPSLSSASGHQSNTAVAYASLVKKLGYDFQLIHANNNCLKSRRGWNPFFNVPHHTASFRTINSRQELTSINKYFEHEYSEVLNYYQPSVCVFATTRFVNIIGAAKAVTSRSTTRLTRVVFTIFETEDAPDCHNPNLIRSAFEEAASILASSGPAYKIYVETPYLRNYLIKCGFEPAKVTLAEYAAASRVTEGVKSEKYSQTVRIGFLGGSRPHRHPELIADLILNEGIPGEIKWCVQLDLQYIRNLRGEDTVRKLIDMHEAGTIELFTGVMGESEYRSAFCSLDLIVLPYSERYEKIGSGIVSEAIYANVIPILPQKSSMNDLYSSLGGNTPTFHTTAATEIEITINAAIDRLPILKRDTRKVRSIWLKHPQSSAQWTHDLLTWLTHDV